MTMITLLLMMMMTMLCRFWVERRRTKWRMMIMRGELFKGLPRDLVWKKRQLNARWPISRQLMKSAACTYILEATTSTVATHFTRGGGVEEAEGLSSSSSQ